MRRWWGWADKTGFGLSLLLSPAWNQAAKGARREGAGGGTHQQLGEMVQLLFAVDEEHLADFQQEVRVIFVLELLQGAAA